MPACFAALISSVPGAAVNSWPSIVNLTGSAIFFFSLRHLLSDRHQLRRALHRSGMFLQVLFEFAAKLCNETAGRHRGRIAERAEGAAEHVIRELANEIDIRL